MLQLRLYPIVGLIVLGTLGYLGYRTWLRKDTTQIEVNGVTLPRSNRATDVRHPVLVTDENPIVKRKAAPLKVDGLPGIPPGTIFAPPDASKLPPLPKGLPLPPKLQKPIDDVPDDSAIGRDVGAST